VDVSQLAVSSMDPDTDDDQQPPAPKRMRPGTEPGRCINNKELLTLYNCFVFMVPPFISIDNCFRIYIVYSTHNMHE
jgi:hypothetical protein